MACGIFVTYQSHLDGPSGGAQICTTEYINVIEHAGIDIDYCLVDCDWRLSTRFLRRIIPSPYFRPTDQRAFDAIISLAAETSPDFVFLNQASLAPLAGRIRKRLPEGSKIVVLSHGLDSTDLLHRIRVRRKLPLSWNYWFNPAITEALTWCLDNREKLNAMRQAALDTARRWQWGDYRRMLFDAVETGLRRAKSVSP